MSAANPCTKAAELYSKNELSAALKEANRCIRILKREAKRQKRDRDSLQDILSQLGATQRLIGNVHLMYNRMKESRTAFVDALKHYSKTRGDKGRTGEAEVQYSLGLVAQYSGRLEEAKKRFAQSAGIFAELGQIGSELHSRLFGARISSVLGETEFSLSEYSEILKASKKVKQKSQRRTIEGDCHFGRAECLRFSDPKSAKEAYKSALKLYSKEKLRKN